MAATRYFGCYGTFTNPDKNEGSKLFGADCIVGDVCSIEFVRQGTNEIPWVVNRFGWKMGRLEGAVVDELLLSRARNWQMRAVLASVYYAADEERFWGEVVLICYSDAFSVEFECFTGNIASDLRKGVRTAVSLDERSEQRVVDSKGGWTPSAREPLPSRASNPAVKLIKDHRSMNEAIVEQARSRNIGCMIVGWAFIIAIVLLVVWGLNAVFHFFG